MVLWCCVVVVLWCWKSVGLVLEKECCGIVMLGGCGGVGGRCCGVGTKTRSLLWCWKEGGGVGKGSFEVLEELWFW